MQNAPPFEWLTLRQFQQHMFLSEPTVRRMLKENRLPGARKFGRLWRIHLPTFRESMLKASR